MNTDVERNDALSVVNRIGTEIRNITRRLFDDVVPLPFCTRRP